MPFALLLSIPVFLGKTILYAILLPRRSERKTSVFRALAYSICAMLLSCGATIPLIEALPALAEKIRQVI